jgi:hypothetical protein
MGGAYYKTILRVFAYFSQNFRVLTLKYLINEYTRAIINAELLALTRARS